MPVAAWVRGSPGLLHDVLAHVLSQHDVKVFDGEQTPNLDPVVTVLVEPEAADWDMARDRALPIVVVSDPALTDGEAVAYVLHGAEAIVATDEVESTIVDVLHIVAQGGTQLAPGLSRAVAALARKATNEPSISLTPRERQILDCIAAGAAVKQTALALGISAKTVENLQGRLFRKLGVRNRAQAVARGHVLGLLQNGS